MLFLVRRDGGGMEKVLKMGEIKVGNSITG